MMSPRYARVLVTGASRGLGAALARTLIAHGHKVFLAARSGAELDELASSLRVRGETVAFACDLAQPQECQRLVAAVEQAWGGVDALINNAAIGPYRPLAEHGPEEIERIVALNLTAPMLLTRALLPGMLERGSGALINVASDLARRPLANMAPYVATKHGLLGFGASLHKEVRSRGVRVSTVLPGIIDSHFNGAQEGSKDARWALKTDALAERIVQLLHLPDTLVIDELTVHPAEGDY